MPPTMTKSAEEVLAEYRHEVNEYPDCNGLIHRIDTTGSCQCGFYIDGEPGGTFPFVPNRPTRRRLQIHKRPVYTLSDEDRARLEEERLREEKKRDERNARREVRKLASVSERGSAENQPPVSISLLVSAEDGQSTDGEDQVD